MKPENEADILNAIMLAVNDGMTAILWRNSVGTAENWDPNTGKLRYSRHGLGAGSADLVGVCNGVFLAIEVKRRDGKVDPKQHQWIALVRKFGGVAGVARNVSEALALVNEAKEAASSHRKGGV